MTTTTALRGEASFEDATYAKVSLRLIPFLFLCYVAAYLDLVNVGFAKLQMLSDLKFSEHGVRHGRRHFLHRLLPVRSAIEHHPGQHRLGEFLIRSGSSHAFQLFEQLKSQKKIAHALVGYATPIAAGRRRDIRASSRAHPKRHESVLAKSIIMQPGRPPPTSKAPAIAARCCSPMPPRQSAAAPAPAYRAGSPR
jgi:hypothetical protein